MIDGRRELMGDEVREMPVVAATIWLAVGVWGMLPEASGHYLPLQLHMTFQNIFTGSYSLFLMHLRQCYFRYLLH